MNVLDQASGDGWHLYNADSFEVLPALPTASVGLSVFSPPFSHLFCYSASTRDLGNSSDDDQFFQQFSFLIPEIMRVTMPGRICAVHVQDISTTKVRHGRIGVRDFSGDVVRAFEKAGWIYKCRITIDKDPQAAAVRTKAKNLMFVQLHKDSASTYPAMADYILLFAAPGENQTPIKNDLTNDEWIKWARPVWYDIDESDTLNVRVAREDKDERHICPLQLGTIERCVRLWSNPGEVVLSPFAGIGSEGFVSLRHGRKFVGIELKSSYFKVAANNLRGAAKQLSFSALLGSEVQP